jgi:AraC family transcriptional regulator, transcriptional activator of pobA
MEKKLYYGGLYGDNSIDFMRGLIHVYPFGVIGKKFNNKVKLHAHSNLFQIFIIENGTTLLLYNDKEHEISGPAFITIPKNVAHGFHHQTDVSGWIITLSDNVLEHMLQTNAEVIFEIDALHISTINPDEKTLVEVYETMKKCVVEYQSNLPGKTLMLQSLVGTLIVQLFRLPSVTTKMNFSFVSDNISKIYFRRFKQLIKTHYSVKKMVEDYANDLVISSGHLNRICHLIANKPPKEVIIDYFIGEAQIFLQHDEKTITEVAYHLGFDDPAYFSRLFRQKTGLTPKSFREKQNIRV